MKRIIIILAFILMIVEGYAKKNVGFEISMNLKNVDKAVILVSERIPNQTAWFIDTLNMDHGKVTFRGKVDYPRMMTFAFSDDENFYGSFSIFVDNSKIKVTGDYNNLRKLVIKGSTTHDEYQDIEKKGKQLFRSYNQLRYKRSQAFKDNRALYDSLTTPTKMIYDSIYNFFLARSNYADSEVLPYYINEFFDLGKLQQMQRAIGNFSDRIQKNAYIIDLNEKIAKHQSTSPGQEAYDFKLQDLDGNEYRLSDYRGKYVLIEFSASWCGWCKLEIPFLKQVYEITRGKNFELFTISIDDSRDKWEKDVKDHNLPWKILSDLKGIKGDVARNFNVSGIPATYLINPEGKIEQRGLRREEMITYIRNLFKE